MQRPAPATLIGLLCSPCDMTRNPKVNAYCRKSLNKLDVFISMQNYVDVCIVRQATRRRSNAAAPFLHLRHGGVCLSQAETKRADRCLAASKGCKAKRGSLGSAANRHCKASAFFNCPCSGRSCWRLAVCRRSAFPLPLCSLPLRA